MDIVKQVVKVIDAQTSASGALQATTRVIAAALRSDACGVFLAGPEGGLVLWALAGEQLDQRVRALAERLAGEALRRVLPATDADRFLAMIVAPLASGARPIGALVVERSGSNGYTEDDVRALVSVSSHVVGVLEGVRLLEALQHISRPGAESEALRPTGWPRPTNEAILRGLAASPGIAIGTAVLRHGLAHSGARTRVAVGTKDQERARLRDAIQKTRNDLSQLQSAMAHTIGEDESLVFATHLLLLVDPMLHERIEDGLCRGQSAEASTEAALDEIVGKLRLAEDAYIRDKADDIEDLRGRVLGHLLGAEPEGNVTTQLAVSRLVTASLVVEMKLRGALAIVSELGAATSHGVLLANGLGLPVVTGIADLTQQVSAGEQLIVDGDDGVLIVRPSAHTLAAYRDRQRALAHKRMQFMRFRDRRGVTADGFAFKIQANVALGSDIDLARENGAEGVGLYRTEFPFMVRGGSPTTEEQARIYAKAYQAFPEGDIVFRILDLAADKLIPGMGLHATNAFHGYRSIRVLFDYPHVLRDQVRAFALASSGRPLSILVPMVTSLEEFRRVKQLATDALAQHPAIDAAPRNGSMIEVPGAVELVPDLAREVDFFSIGTNDLTQYALAVDREDPRIAAMHDEFHPAILRLVQRVVAPAHAAGKSVSVCGEMAARPRLAVALLAIGVDGLSVTPRAIPELKQTLAGVSLRPLREDMSSILQCSTGPELRTAIGAHLDAAATRSPPSTA